MLDLHTTVNKLPEKIAASQQHELVYRMAFYFFIPIPILAIRCCIGLLLISVPVIMQ